MVSPFAFVAIPSSSANNSQLNRAVVRAGSGSDGTKTRRDKLLSLMYNNKQGKRQNDSPAVSSLKSPTSSSLVSRPSTAAKNTVEGAGSSVTSSTSAVTSVVGTGGGQLQISSVSGSRSTRRGKPGPPVSREEFDAVVAACRLPYSLAWANAAYETCLGNGVDEAALKQGSGEWGNDRAGI